MSSIDFKFVVNEIRKSAERMSQEREARLKNAKNLLSFGIPFLDDCLRGIFTEDVVLYGARSNIGKTQLAMITAMANVRAGKRVHFFALEAARFEIERRIKYQMIADVFFKLIKPELDRVGKRVFMNYADWYYGKFDDVVGPYESEIEGIYNEVFGQYLKTFYRTGHYTVEDFKKQFLAIQDETDLVILDHVHIIDHTDPGVDENRGQKAIMKTISDLVNSQAFKPVVLVAHLRKLDKAGGQITPSLEDFMGSSDIGKIATKAVMIAPEQTQTKTPGKWSTFIRPVKMRVDSSLTRYVGKVAFDSDIQGYDPAYYLSKPNLIHNEFDPITNDFDRPHWAKGMKLAANGTVPSEPLQRRK
jgi:hypothetical protein